MTKEEANELLDSVKDGNHYPSIKRITEALWATGDAVRPVPVHPRPFSQDGINEWMESTRMAQSQGVGDSPNRDMERHQQRFDAKNERNQ